MLILVTADTIFGTIEIRAFELCEDLPKDLPEEVQLEGCIDLRA